MLRKEGFIKEEVRTETKDELNIVLYRKTAITVLERQIEQRASTEDVQLRMAKN